jgi:hypothetical protein
MVREGLYMPHLTEHWEENNAHLEKVRPQGLNLPKGQDSRPLPPAGLWFQGDHHGGKTTRVQNA